MATARTVACLKFLSLPCAFFTVAAPVAFRPFTLRNFVVCLSPLLRTGVRLYTLSLLLRNGFGLLLWFLFFLLVDGIIYNTDKMATGVCEPVKILSQ